MSENTELSKEEVERQAVVAPLAAICVKSDVLSRLGKLGKVYELPVIKVSSDAGVSMHVPIEVAVDLASAIIGVVIGGRACIKVPRRPELETEPDRSGGAESAQQ